MEFPHPINRPALPSFWELLLLADPCREMVLRYPGGGGLHSPHPPRGTGRRGGGPSLSPPPYAG